MTISTLELILARWIRRRGRGRVIPLRMDTAMLAAYVPYEAGYQPGPDQSP